VIAVGEACWKIGARQFSVAISTLEYLRDRVDLFQNS
jgi:hypothetical protein